MEGMTARARPLTGTPSRAPEPSYAMAALILGCLFVGSSSALIKLSGATAGTAAFLRCALALVVFAPLLVVSVAITVTLRCSRWSGDGSGCRRGGCSCSARAAGCSSGRTT